MNTFHLVWWHESRYKINYSNFFRGGWRGALKWCNVWAHRRTISDGTTDFQPTLTYKSTSADLHQQHLTFFFCTVCGVLFDNKRESTVVSSGVRDVMLVTESGFIQWNHDYFYYMFWIADLLATSLVWQFIFINWSVLWKGCFAVFKVKFTMKVVNLSECLPGQYLWWSNLVWWGIIISQSITQIYHFVMFKVKATIISTRSSKILKLLQPKLVWWYIITRQGKTQWKDFLAFRSFTQGVKQRIWLGWLWTRLLPLLAISVSKAGVNTSSNPENVERTLLL